MTCARYRPVVRKLGTSSRAPDSKTAAVVLPTIFTWARSLTVLLTDFFTRGSGVSIIDSLEQKRFSIQIEKDPRRSRGGNCPRGLYASMIDFVTSAPTPSISAAICGESYVGLERQTQAIGGSIS